ncbi:MAG: DUF488 domain-containing protein [Flammeovirgaceae bacterium]|nr:DUF488 domain-containing protein [Flammeovirgaceae bacterium]
MNVFTIGFTEKTAKRFFELIRSSGVKRVVDVRLNNTGQLAGFSKQADLAYFLRELCQIEYIHVPELAPTKDILDVYKKHGGAWSVYEAEFLNLMERRRIDQCVAKDIVDQGCLLCSENKPHHCHRRLVVEYLQNKWGDINTTHLL